MADPIAGLRDVHLPDMGWPEFFAGLAAGLALALLVSFLLPFITRRPAARRDVLTEELARLRGLAAGERLHGQARLLRQLGGPPIPGLAEALYRPAPQLSPDDVERELLTLIKAAR